MTGAPRRAAAAGRPPHAPVGTLPRREARTPQGSFGPRCALCRSRRARARRSPARRLRLVARGGRVLAALRLLARGGAVLAALRLLACGGRRARGSPARRFAAGACSRLSGSSSATRGSAPLAAPSEAGRRMLAAPALTPSDAPELGDGHAARALGPAGRDARGHHAPAPQGERGTPLPRRRLADEQPRRDDDERREGGGEIRAAGQAVPVRIDRPRLRRRRRRGVAPPARPRAPGSGADRRRGRPSSGRDGDPPGRRRGDAAAARRCAAARRARTRRVVDAL
jgi:hypothetical protein